MNIFQKVTLVTTIVAVISISLLVYVDQAYASCSGEYEEPCFTLFKTVPYQIDKKYIMQSFESEGTEPYSSWSIPDREWDFGKELEPPVIVCSEFIGDGELRQIRIKWENANTISNIEYLDNWIDFCDAFLPPMNFDEPKTEQRTNHGGITLDETVYPVCGPGTVLNDGVCFVYEEQTIEYQIINTINSIIVQIEKLLGVYVGPTVSTNGFIPLAYAACTENHEGPCFDSFRNFYGKLTIDKIRETISSVLDANYKDWSIPNRSWDDNMEGLEYPAHICTEYIIDDVTHRGIILWVDDHTLSSMEENSDDKLCDKFYPPMPPVHLEPFPEILTKTLDEIMINWDKEQYHNDATGIVTVIDNELNLEPEAVDNFKILVWSDIDSNGITLIITETEDNSGVFNGRVFFSTDNMSSGHRLQVGDLIYATYGDITVTSKIKHPELVKASCESDAIKVIDGICQPIENELTCKVFHFLGYAFDYCDGDPHPIYLVFLYGTVGGIIFGIIWWKIKK